MYGATISVDKGSFLESISFINSIVQDFLWIIEGEFNLIRYPLEKKWGICRLDAARRQFGNLISELDLVDVQPKNGLHT